MIKDNIYNNYNIYTAACAYIKVKYDTKECDISKCLEKAKGTRYHQMILEHIMQEALS